LALPFSAAWTLKSENPYRHRDRDRAAWRAAAGSPTFDTRWREGFRKINQRPSLPSLAPGPRPLARPSKSMAPPRRPWVKVQEFWWIGLASHLAAQRRPCAV